MSKRLQVVGGTEGGDEELRLWLDRYIQDHSHLTTAVLSRQDHIGVSRTALDQYLEGTYFLPQTSGGAGVKPEKSKIEIRIRAYRERVEGTVRHGWANTFVETRSWLQLQQACATAISENVIVVVYGAPGVGKSRCLTEFATRKLTTAPISVLCSANVTTRHFVQKIARALGLDDKQTIARLEDAIAEKLKKNPRPLIVDQANYLNEKSLGSVCYLWELARIPIILVGTLDLYNLFNTSRLTQDVRAQLSSRVAMHYPLAELSLTEVKSICKRALGPDATDENISKVFNVTSGIHRYVDMIVPRIKKRNADKLKSGEVSMTDIIETAGRRLMVG
jgi:DNA transposition AAA+ family ATPase